MTVRFNTNVHAYVRLPDGKMLPVQIDELRQALELLYARIFGIDTTTTSIAESGFLVAPATDGNTAGVESAGGTAFYLGGQEGVTVFRSGDNVLVTLDFVNLTSATPAAGDYVSIYDQSAFAHRRTTVADLVAAASGVVGPGASTDHAIVRWDGTTGLLVQNSGLYLDDLSGADIDLRMTNGVVLRLHNPSSPSVNYVTIRGHASGNSPIISVDGPGSNISLSIAPKGASGTVSITRPSITTFLNAQHDHLNTTGGGVLTLPAVGIADSSTVGQVLRVTGSSTYAFGALDLADSDAVTGTLPAANLPSNQKIADLTFIIDGGGSAITTGIKGDLQIDFACTITQVTMLADQSGSIVVDIWKDTYANFPATVADTITASAKPTISAATKSQDSTLTGWTTSIAAGDHLRFNVDSASTVTRVTLALKVTKT